MNELKIHGEILSSICIRNGDEWWALDFLVDETSFYLVDQNWIEKAIYNNYIDQEELLSCIKEGDFKKISKIKDDLYLKDADIFEITDHYPLQEEAYWLLWNKGNKNNQGIVKQQFFNKFSEEFVLPWSTLKGILRTAYLCKEARDGRLKMQDIQDRNRKEENNKREIKQINDRLDDTLFKWILCEDCTFNDPDIQVQVFQSKNKPPREGQEAKDGISFVLQTVKGGSFDTNLIVAPNDQGVDLTPFEGMLADYSKMLIERERYILEGIEYSRWFIQQLEDYHQEKKYPIKVGTGKKSLSYKIFWEEQIQRLSEIKGKNRLEQSRKLGIGDKTITIDESGDPVGWILLSFD